MSCPNKPKEIPPRLIRTPALRPSFSSTDEKKYARSPDTGGVRNGPFLLLPTSTPAPPKLLDSVLYLNMGFYLAQAEA